jgi:hypothetical protein
LIATDETRSVVDFEAKQVRPIVEDRGGRHRIKSMGRVLGVKSLPGHVGLYLTRHDRDKLNTARSDDF